MITVKKLIELASDWANNDDIAIMSCKGGKPTINNKSHK